MKKDKKVVKLRKNNFFKNSIFIPLILLITIFLILAFSPLFNIKNVKVEGILSLDEKFVKDESGIKIGQNILRINKNHVKSILLNISYVKNVNIKRNWPDGVTISITEKEAIAKVLTFGACIALDDEGRVLNVYTDNFSLDVPLIENIEIFSYGINKSLETPNETKINNILEVLKIFEKNDMLKNVEKIHEEDGVIIYTKEGHVANLGDTNDLDYKIKRLKAVMEKEINEKYYFDVSNLNIDTISRPLWILTEEKKDEEVVE